MTFVKRLFRLISIFFFEHKYIFQVSKKNNIEKFYSMASENMDLLPIKDINFWMKNFNKAICSNLNIKKVADEFFSCRIKIIKSISIDLKKVIPIIVTRNDLTKLKTFLNYHRNLGIMQFLIIDNNSNDGTREYLLKQKDVFLFYIDTKYSSSNRVAWIDRVIAFIGYNNWYYVADTDELLAYENCENVKIDSFLQYLQSNGIYRPRAIMLDMYPKGKICDKDYYKKYTYFDTNSYKRKFDYRFYSINGGPRERVFGIPPCLTKYPIFFLSKNDLYINSHFLFPYAENFKYDCMLALKHYKFLKMDIDRINDIMKNASYYNNNQYYNYYKKTIDQNKTLTFYNKESCKFTDSSSLNVLKFYNKIKWNSKDVKK